VLPRLRHAMLGAREFPMFIAIKELLLHPVDFTEEFAPGVIDFGPDLQQREPLHSSGRAQLIEEHHGKHNVIEDIRVAGQLTTSLEVPCARCLEPVKQKVEREFDLLYRPQGSDAGQEELSVTAVDAEIGYYTGDGLLLEDALREQVLLALPLKILCQPDCKGLCPQCGKNLNHELCGCEKPHLDPRMTALKEIRDRLPN
jgi:uncharacterized protein